MIIGICGEKESGKGTVAEYLSSRYGFREDAYARPLKEMLKAAFGDQIESNLSSNKETLLQHPHAIRPRAVIVMKDFLRERYEYALTTKQVVSLVRLAEQRVPRTGRELMQFVGTDLFRQNVDKDIWISLLGANVSLREDACVADVRFPDEVKNILDRGGVILRLKRGESLDTHVSENSFGPDSQYKHIITNNSTKEELYSNVEDWLSAVVK